MEELLKEIRACTVCQAHLPHLPRPVLQASEASKVLIIGQAPGLKVQQSGIPWDDASGDNLRKWLGITSDAFYNDKYIALLPMGFCYPGTGKTGDLPPRPECAPMWHQKVLDCLQEVELTLLIGQYAQKHYLGNQSKENLTRTVQNFEAYLPEFFPLPHPSPRNNIWQKKNPWFGENLLPELQRRVREILFKNVD
ncbi:MAG: uracil-DNA glycosylase family protein [Saprospiraceae bacterium]|nr:uracil-DNA glycosylase family protein [Saprospiraceae bacterium]